MLFKREFLKLAAGVVAGLALGQSSSARAASPQNSWEGIVYTAKNPGMWKGKAGSHAPQVRVDGSKVKITTPHGMSKAHFIVRHTIVSSDGTVLGDKTFQPSDQAVSTFDLPDNLKGGFYATSFCNKHDLWVTPFSA